MTPPTPGALRALEDERTGREEQSLLIQAKRHGNLARFRPSERCETAASHVKGRKRSMPSFRRFRKPKYESSEIIIGHHDDPSRYEMPTPNGRGWQRTASGPKSTA
jgi:hypothetical protein